MRLSSSKALSSPLDSVIGALAARLSVDVIYGTLE